MHALVRPHGAVARLMVLLVVSVGLLSGCSGDGSAPAAGPSGSSGVAATVDQDVVLDELAAEFSGDNAQPSSLAEGRCFARALVGLAPAGALEQAGIVGTDGHVADPIPVLDEETAGLWVDAQADCLDFVDVSTEAFAAQSKGRLDSTAYAACFRDALTDAQIRRAQVLALSGGIQSPEVAALTTAQSACAQSALPPD